MAINGISGSLASLVDSARQPGAARTGALGQAIPAVAQEDQRAVSTTSAAMVAAGPPVALDRVTALRAAIAAGTYRANPQGIAGRMVESDLAGAGL